MSSRTSLSLVQILDLVGKLDDSSGDDVPRSRFRRYLKDNVHKVGQVRDYIEECLRNKGTQYNRALQDLVNHLGNLLDFEVAFGRYQGVVGEIGYDGYWSSTEGFNLVVEVKTTEAYAISTSTLIGYVESLIDEKKIEGWDNCLGLYVLGRPDPELHQLENNIIATGRTDKIRIISVESLLSLAELYTQYDVSHDDVLALIKPSKPSIDPIVKMLANMVAQEPYEEEPEEPEEPQEKEERTTKIKSEANFWLTPAGAWEEYTVEEVIEKLVGERKLYGFGDKTPGRKKIETGDWICFYASGKGVIAHARVASNPEKKPEITLIPDRFPWIFQLDNTELYIDNPVIIDQELRSRLDYFKGKDPAAPWGWFVQTTRHINLHDFNLLTRKTPEIAS